MRYYIINSEGKEVSFDLSTNKSPSQKSFSVRSAASVNKEYFIKSIAGKDFISEDNKRWEKLPRITSKDSLVFFNDAIKVYRGFKPSGIANAKAGSLVTDMPGKIVKVLTTKGALVSQGDTIVILDAMKMENEIKADVTGTVKVINVTEGQTVDAGHLMVEIEE